MYCTVGLYLRITPLLSGQFALAPFHFLCVQLLYPLSFSIGSKLGSPGLLQLCKIGMPLLYKMQYLSGNNNLKEQQQKPCLLCLGYQLYNSVIPFHSHRLHFGVVVESNSAHFHFRGLFQIPPPRIYCSQNKPHNLFTNLRVI